MAAAASPTTAGAAAARGRGAGGCANEEELKDLGTEAILRQLGLPADLNAARVAPGFVSKGKGKRSDDAAGRKAVEGRKGLPQSLLNRFCRVRVDEMLETDMVDIAHNLLTCLQQQQQHQEEQQRQRNQEQPHEQAQWPPRQARQQQEQQQREGEERTEVPQGADQRLLSACVVRCVRLLAELGVQRPFKGLTDSVYNLRDAVRVIRLYAHRLPTGDPRGAIAVALLSRLRSREDLREASYLASLCFPPKLFELLEQQAPALPLQDGQHQQERGAAALEAVAALLRPEVAPAAVLHAVQQEALPSLASFAGALEGRQPVDLIVRGGHVSFGDMTLAQQSAAPTNVTGREEQLPTGDPRGAVAVALLSRLRSREDLREASYLASLCFPPKLFELLEQQAPALPLQDGQHQQERGAAALEAVAALLRPEVAPAAVLHAVQQEALPSLASFAGALEGRQPVDLIVRGGHVSFGDMTLAQQSAAPTNVTDRQEQRVCVSAVAAALAAGFPVLLTGEKGAGKSSIVRWLAAACGATVCEVQLGPSVDTSDLLGVYRQIQPKQRLLLAADAAQQVADCLLQQELPQQHQHVQQHQQQLKDLRAAVESARQQLVEASDLLGVYRQIQPKQRLLLAADAALQVAGCLLQQELPQQHQHAQQHQQQLKDLRAAVESARQQLVETADFGAIRVSGTGEFVPPKAQPRMLLQQIAAATAALLEGCGAAAASWLTLSGKATAPNEATHALLQRRSQRAWRLLQQGCVLGGLQLVGSAATGAARSEEETSRFEWTDSAVVDAVRRGHWLLLRSAHLCSASVLDRLNALLEDGGCLLLTEGGPPREVKRHPNFRILFTAEAAGSCRLSSALRNRCCEVYVPPPGVAAPAAGQEPKTSAPQNTGSQATKECAPDEGTKQSTTTTVAPAARRQPLLLEGLTKRLLGIVATLLRSSGVSGTAGTEQDTALRELLSGWSAALLATEADLTGGPEGDEGQPTPVAAASATLRIAGVFISFCCRKAHCNTSTRCIRLCPLLLQDSYRLLLAGGKDLSLAAAEVMSLQHAAVQLLLQLLGDESVLSQFALEAQSMQLDVPQQQQLQQKGEQEQQGDTGDSGRGEFIAELRSVRDDLGEGAIAAGLAGLQAIARRVAGRNSKYLAAAAAARWRCLQSWGSAYAAAENVDASEEQSVAATTGTPRTTPGAVTTKTTAPETAGTERDDSISVGTLFQCFLWQYTAALDSSPMWRLLLLHLLAACYYCCSVSERRENSSRLCDGGDYVQQDSDWAILRGAIERHVMLHRERRKGSSSISEGLVARSVASDVSLMGSVVAACLGNEEQSVAATTGTPRTTPGAVTTKTTAPETAGTELDDSISVGTLFQCFLWQYTAALDSSPMWRLLLLHLLAACYYCCSVSKRRENSSRLCDGGDYVQQDSDWAILRGAIERHVMLHRERRKGSSSISEGLVARSVASDVSLMGSVVAACLGSEDKGLPLLAAAVRLFMWGAANAGDLSARLRVLQQLHQDTLQQHELLQKRQRRTAVRYLAAAPLLAAAVRLFMWGAANAGDLSARLGVLQQLHQDTLQQHERLQNRQRRTAFRYLAAACSALQEIEQGPFLLLPGAAAAAAVVVAAAVPPDSLPLIYAAGRLIGISSSLSSGCVNRHSGDSPSRQQQQQQLQQRLLLHEVVQVLRAECAAFLLPERLLLLQRQKGNRVLPTKCTRCSLGDREFWCLLFAYALPVKELQRDQQDLLEQELLQQELPQQWNESEKSEVGELMQRLFEGLRQLSSCVVFAADETLRMLVQCGGGSVPAAAAVLTEGLTQQCKHLARCFSAWADLLQVLSLPSCSAELFVESLKDFGASASSTTAGARDLRGCDDWNANEERENHCTDWNAVATAAARASAVDFVAAELLRPLDCMSATLVPLKFPLGGFAVAEAGEGKPLHFLEGRQHYQQHRERRVQGGDGSAASAFTGIDAMSNTWRCLLPLQLGQHEAQTVRGWLLRELLHAAPLTASLGPEPTAATTESVKAADKPVQGAAATGASEERGAASLCRRLACTAPSLGLGFSLLLHAGHPAFDHVSIGSFQQQHQRQDQQQRLLHSKSLLFHAPALHALLLSSCLLRAAGREGAAESLEAQVNEALLPSYQQKPASGPDSAGLPSLFNSRSCRVAALRAAAAAEGLIDSRQQRWVSLSSSAIVSVGLLQAQLAAAAAVHLGIEHAAELLLLNLWMQPHQHMEGRPVGAAPDDGGPRCSRIIAALSVALEKAAQTQLQQQQEMLPIFTLPATALSWLSSEDPASSGSQPVLTIPVPPTLLDAAAVLTATVWQQQQNQQREQQLHHAKLQQLSRFAACAAVEVLSLMWRTEVDIHCNDAFGLKGALLQQGLLQDACAPGRAADAGGTTPAMAAGHPECPVALLTRQALARLQEKVGGFHGAAAARATATATVTKALRRLERSSQLQGTLGIDSSCTYTARIVVEVQEHATVSSASACFVVLQRLQRQLQRLETDRRRACRLLELAACAENVDTDMEACMTSAAAADAGTETATATAAEWAAVVGFAAALWSFCGPVGEGDSGIEMGKGADQRVQRNAWTAATSVAVCTALKDAWASIAGFLRDGDVAAVAPHAKAKATAAAKAALTGLREVADGLQEILRAEAPPTATTGNAEAAPWAYAAEALLLRAAAVDGCDGVQKTAAALSVCRVCCC
ncbi:hypothetical protein EPH_0005420 [Eimeria praecox]|uniref:ATPase dynein-related AAA domain-containing protein n=1 Tax=Eimeria praecox TaxID=51316 RepID=U6G5K2_9EIME|nr:hypothetical protein EPH_0005420 [Eimeria praecox]